MNEPASPSVPCPHVVRLPVLGVETTFATNSREALERVVEAWGRWAALRKVADVVSSSGAVVRIVVRSTAGPTPRHREAGSAPPGGEGSPGGFPRPRVTGTTTLRIDGSGGWGVADTGSLESVAHVDREVVSRRAEFIEGWLEPLTLFLLGALDRQPLHAAAVLDRRAEVDEETTAILLAGPSGAGKSTLTYAAWRSGRFGVLADEPVYVQLRPRFRVWGRRARIHLPVGVRASFPELRGIAPTRLPTGKTKLVVDADDEGRPYAERAGLCLLERARGDRPRLEPVTVERAVAEIAANLEPGYHLFQDTIGERIARVARGGAWRLSLTDDPAAALPLLDEAVTAVREAG